MSHELTVIDQREITFCGDENPAVIIEGGRICVPLRPICDFLGISWPGKTRLPHG
jgi:hypothetical protein